MTREEKITSLKHLFMGGTSFEEVLKEAMDFADSHPHWISVKDELPKENSGLAVVVNYMGHLDFMKYCKSGWHNNKRWCVPKGIITHWMPLPKMPVLSKLESTRKNHLIDANNMIEGGEE